MEAYCTITQKNETFAKYFEMYFLFHHLRKKRASTTTNAHTRTKLFMLARPIGHVIFAGRSMEERSTGKTGAIWGLLNTTKHATNHLIQQMQMSSPPCKGKKQTAYNLKIREALKIRKHKCCPGKGLNEDIWDPVLHTLDTLKH